MCARADFPPYEDPRPDQPCDGDACGPVCHLEDGQWVREGSRVNGWGAEEDVLFLCMCDHHVAA